MQRVNPTVLNNAYVFVTIHTWRPVVELCQRFSEGRNMVLSCLIITFSSFLLCKLHNTHFSIQTT